jgi:hypothetical protein
MSQERQLPIQFFEEVKFRSRAEGMLRGRKPGAYLVWSSGAQNYNLTYVSKVGGDIVTNPILREAGGHGCFYFERSTERQLFKNLEDLVSSRSYLTPAAEEEAAVEEEAPAPPQLVDEVMRDPEFGRLLPRGSSSSSSSSSSFSGAQLSLTSARQRSGKGSGRGEEGAAQLPEALRAPPPAPLVVPLDDDDAEQYDMNDVAIDEDKYTRGVRPTCSERVLLPFLARTAIVGGVALLLLLGLRYALLAHSRRLLQGAARQVEEAVVSATETLVVEKLGGAGGLEGCREAVGAWAEQCTTGPLSVPIRALLASPDAAWLLVYIRFQLVVAVLGGFACLGLFFVHTGKSPVRFLNGTEGVSRMPPPPRSSSYFGGGGGGGGDGTLQPQTQQQEDEYLVQRLAAEERRRRVEEAEAEEERRAIKRPTQMNWALAFFSLLAPTLLASHGACSLLNAAALAPGSLGRAAQGLSVRWPAAHLPPPTAQRGGVFLKDLPGSPLRHALQWGTWQGAHSYGGVPLECLEAVADIVEPLVDGPPVGAFPLLWAGGGGGGGGGWDPLGLTYLSGWLRVGAAEGGILALQLPTEAGLAKGVMITASFFMIAVVVFLFGVDTWHTECRPALLRRAARAKKTEAERRKKAGAP